MTPPSRSRLTRPLMLMVAAALLGGLWAGLLRLGWQLPTWSTRLALDHGPLMAAGFLGTLVSLERAVALGERWSYAAPAAGALGATALLLGAPTLLGAGLLTTGSVLLLLVSLVVFRRHPASHYGVIAAGGGGLLVGNLLWLGGLPQYRAVLWWQGFLLLVIVGERLELNRVRRPPPRVRRRLTAALVVYVAGLGLSLVSLSWGTRLTGAAALGLAAWLLTYDLARRNARKGGVTGFIGVNLLLGYGWLAVHGLLALLWAPLYAGIQYDAWLHALFLGFVFSMVFAHAPIILPGVLGVQVTYRPVLYLPPLLLHLTLLLRLFADLTADFALRRWSGLLNELAILAFVLLLAGTALRQRTALAADSPPGE